MKYFPLILGPGSHVGDVFLLLALFAIPAEGNWAFIQFLIVAVAGVFHTSHDQVIGLHRVYCTLPLSQKALGACVYIKAVVYYPLLYGVLQLLSRQILGSQDFATTAWSVVLAMGCSSLVLMASLPSVTLLSKLDKALTPKSVGCLFIAVPAAIFMTLEFLSEWDVLQRAKLPSVWTMVVTACVACVPLIWAWRVREMFWGEQPGMTVAEDASHGVKRRTLAFRYSPIPRSRARAMIWLPQVELALLGIAVPGVLLLFGISREAAGMLAALISLFATQLLPRWFDELRCWRCLPMTSRRLSLHLSLYPFLGVACLTLPASLFIAMHSLDALGKSVAVVAPLLGAVVVLKGMVMSFHQFLVRPAEGYGWIPAAGVMVAFLGGVYTAVFNSPQPLWTALCMLPVLSLVGFLWIYVEVVDSSDIYRTVRRRS